jgi:hypothetical protein
MDTVLFYKQWHIKHPSRLPLLQAKLSVKCYLAHPMYRPRRCNCRCSCMLRM